MRTGMAVNIIVGLLLIDMRTGAVVEVSTVVMMAVGVDMLAGAEIGEVTAAMSGLEVVAGVTYAVEALADTIFGGASAIGEMVLLHAEDGCRREA